MGGLVVLSYKNMADIFVIYKVFVVKHSLRHSSHMSKNLGIFFFNSNR